MADCPKDVTPRVFWYKYTNDARQLAACVYPKDAGSRLLEKILYCYIIMWHCVPENGKKDIYI
jgi:hypothetical protein